MGRQRKGDVVEEVWRESVPGEVWTGTVGPWMPVVLVRLHFCD